MQILNEYTERDMNQLLTKTLREFSPMSIKKLTRYGTELLYDAMEIRDDAEILEERLTYIKPYVQSELIRIISDNPVTDGIGEEDYRKAFDTFFATLTVLIYDMIKHDEVEELTWADFSLMEASIKRLIIIWYALNREKS